MIKKTILVCSTVFFLSGLNVYTIPDMEDIEPWVGLTHNVFMGAVIGLLPIVSGEQVYQAIKANQFPYDNVRGARSAFIVGSILGYYSWFELLSKFQEESGQNYAYALALATLLVPFVAEHAIIRPMHASLKS